MKYLLSLVLVCLTFFSSVGNAASMMKGFTDPEDGMFDVSHYLAEKKGFFPVPVIITEPAVGVGAGAALVFLHDPLAGRVPDGETFDPQSTDAKGKLIPPSISVAFGAYTENDTWFAGGGHLGVWKNDKIRYTAALATGSINMKFYPVSNIAIDFNLEPVVFYQGIKFRLSDSGFFAGINYLLIDTTSQFDIPFIPPDLLADRNTRDAAAILSLDYDSRDTIFTPNEGFNASMQVSLFRELVGSDTEFEAYKAKLIYFTPILTELVLGLRAEFDAVEGDDKDIPFYQYPFVQLRGIPMMRYQGKSVGVGEAELRWNFTSRWSVIGFGGVGKTVSINILDENEKVYSKGAGLRYFIARRFGAHVGFDVAKGPEDTAFYLQFGHAWR